MRAAKLRSRMVSTIASVGRAQRKPAGRLVLLALAVQLTGVSCQGTAPDGNGAGGAQSGRSSEDDVSTIRSSLTADDFHPSKPFRDSVGRTILPTGTTLPDPLRGEADVAPDGSALYRIPIDLPDGIEGMQPVMSIDYQGRRGSGLLGPGWNITGLSAIVRCRRNIAQDGSEYIAANESGVPRFLADSSFCLDGTRLIHQAGTPAPMQTGAEYLSEMGPPTKVVVTAHDNTSGPLRLSQVLSFKAFLPDGRIAYYGSTAGSRLEAGNRRYGFYIDRMEDRFGNSIRFTYRRAASSNPADTMRAVEPTPDKITYTGQGMTGGDHELAFSYTTGNWGVRYIENLSIETSTVVSSIAISSKYASFDAAGTPVNGVIRIYRFQQDITTGTGKQALAKIEKCTAIQNSTGAWIPDVCTAPVQIGWTKNPNIAWEHLAFDDIADIVPAGAQNFARLTASDLNNDGRDDLIYKVGVDASCAKWVYRISSGRSFGPPVDMGLPPSCGTTTAVGDKFLGDIFTANLDGKGAVDLVGPRQTGVGFAGYFGATIGVNAGGAPTFETFDLDAAAQAVSGVTRTDPNIGFGEFSPMRSSVLRPNIAAGATTGSWTAFEMGRNAQFQMAALKSISVGQYLKSWPPVFVDLNGDQLDELVSPDSQVSLVVATPTTFSSNLPVLRSGNVVTGRFWFMDANGDGLKDVAYISAADSTPGGVVHVRLNKGDYTFGPDINTALSNGWNIGVAGIRSGIDTGVRVADLNLDGIDDILLVDNGASLTSGSLSNGTFAARRSVVMPLVSTGRGGFELRFTNNFPRISDPATGFNGLPAPLNGYRLSQTLDADGDGLTDLVQVQGGRLRLYLRKGDLPDLVTTVSEGSARTITYTLRALTETDRYTSTVTCRQAVWPRTCASRGTWVVTDLAISGPLPQNLAYTYQDAYADGGGRGFEGFALRTITDAVRGRRVQISFSDSQLLDNSTTPAKYFYRTSQTTVDTVRVPGGKLYRTTTTRPLPGMSIVQKRLVLNSTNAQVETSDCTESSDFACNAATVRRLSLSNQSTIHDSMGHVVDEQRSTVVAGHPMPVIDRTFRNFDPPDLVNWLINKPNLVVSESTSLDGEMGRRELVLQSDGIKLRTRTTPGPTSSREERFEYDARGRLTKVVDLGDATVDVIMARQTVFLYDGPGGIYPSAVQMVRDVNIQTPQTMQQIWRHPAFGHVIQRIDANNVMQRHIFDAAGRLMSTFDTRSGPVTLTYGFLDAGKRWQVVRTFGNEKDIKELDVLGRLAARGWTTTTGSTVFETRGYDPMGHLASVKSNFPDGNNYEMTYVDDALDRPVSRCTTVSRRLTSTGAPVAPTPECTAYVYDGLKSTAQSPAGTFTDTIADEAGRVVSKVRRGSNAAGAVVETFNYTHGPFDQVTQIENAASPQGAGTVRFSYDSRRRLQTMSRYPNVTTYLYNGFDEVSTHIRSKDPSIPGTSPQVARDRGFDPAGRLRKDGGDRYDWDTAANGMWRLFAAGSPDGIDTSNTYNASGMPETNAWQVGADFFAFTRTYDAKGRLDTLTYPQADTFGRLKVRYSYNQFTGLPESLVDVGTNKVLWQATARTAAGQLRDESMNDGQIKRTTKYYEGALVPYNVSLQIGTTPALIENLQYRPGGNLDTRATTLGTSATTEQLGYDAIDRVWTWNPAVGASNGVSYQYGADGELLRRVSGTESARYMPSEIPGTSTSPYVSRMGLVFTLGTTTLPAENYDSDALGRTTTTPAGTFTYTSRDLPRTFTSRSGATTTYAYDAFGAAVKKTFSSGGEEIAVGGLFRRIKGGPATIYEHALTVEGDVVGTIQHITTPYARMEFYQRDQVGTPRALAAGTTGVTQISPLDPFGNAVNPSTPGLPNDTASVAGAGAGYHGFQQQRHDGPAGLIDMNGRYYSPRLGRFMSDDPVIGDPTRGQAYSAKMFAYGNPVRLTDPTGYCTSAPEGAVNDCLDQKPLPVIPGPYDSNWKNTKYYASEAKSYGKKGWDWAVEASEDTWDWVKARNPFRSETRGPSVPTAPTSPVAGSGTPTSVRGGPGSPQSSTEATTGVPLSGGHDGAEGRGGLSDPDGPLDNTHEYIDALAKALERTSATMDQLGKWGRSKPIVALGEKAGKVATPASFVAGAMQLSQGIQRHNLPEVQSGVASLTGSTVGLVFELFFGPLAGVTASTLTEGAANAQFKDPWLGRYFAYPMAAPR